MTLAESLLAAGTSGRADGASVVCLAVVVIIVGTAIAKARGGS